MSARRGLIVAAGVPTLLTWLHAQYYGPWIVDDAGLTFAYARSLATGAGPVLQPGTEPVEGYSNPAWMAILVGGRWLGLFDHGSLLGRPDIVMFPKIVALLCCFGVFAAMFAVAVKVARHPVVLTVIAGGAVAAVPSFVIWTTSGLENALYALAVVGLAAVLACAVADAKLLAVDFAVAAGALAAVATLSRPDGIVYAAAFPIVAVIGAHRGRLRQTATAALISVGTFAVPVGAYLTWRLVMFGDYLPNPARAKEQQLPTLADFDKPAALLDYLGWLTAVLGVAVVAAALSRRSANRPVILALLVPLGLAVFVYAALATDWMAQHRFATPVWPLTALVIAVAAVDGLADASTRRRLVAAAAAIVATVLSMAGFSAQARSFRAEPTAPLCIIAQNTGYLLNGYADILEVNDGAVLAVDGGGSSLTSRLRFVDLSGLADRRIARFWQNDDPAGLRGYVFDELRPTFIRLFRNWDHRARLALTEDPRMARDYVLLWTAGGGGGDWVRRDAVPDAAALTEARGWGTDSMIRIDERYQGVTPQRWWCGEVLRPTQFKSGTPATSPLTS